jgi:hypothetical protein
VPATITTDRMVKEYTNKYYLAKQAALAPSPRSAPAG